MLLAALHARPEASAAEPIAGRTPVPDLAAPVLQEAVTGIVVAARTGQPLAGAQVAVEGAS